VDTTCQICKIHGHPASDCWWRYEDKDDSNDDTDHKDKDKAANIASYGVDTNWYIDSGATNHITGRASFLQMTSLLDVIVFTPPAALVWKEVILVIQFCIPLIVLYVLIISFMFHTHQKIFFPFIS
jgi:hypothetical protein